MQAYGLRRYQELVVGQLYTRGMVQFRISRR
jgi:hypothetical protein